MCDPFNRTGANFVMVALVLKTFVTRLLLLGHFQFCVLVCVCVLLFFLLFFFFFFFFFFLHAFVVPVDHSLDNDRSMVETSCFNVGLCR